MSFWGRGRPSPALLDAEQRCGLARSNAAPEMLAAAGLLDHQQVAGGRVGGHRGNSLDLSWTAAESRMTERSTSAPSPYLGRRGSQSAYIDQEQVAGISCSTAKLRRRMLQEGGGDPCPCLSTMLEEQAKEDRKIRSSLSRSWQDLASASKVDREQRTSRRSSVLPHVVALAAAVDSEQEVVVRQRLGEQRMEGLQLAGRIDREQAVRRGSEARRRGRELEELNTLGDAVALARATNKFKTSLDSSLGESLLPRWKRLGHHHKDKMADKNGFG